MKITADQEGVQAIRDLCDCALKAGGLANVGCLKVLQCLDQLGKPKQPITPEPERPKTKHKRGKIKKK
jgi:hypothetical protein